MIVVTIPRSLICYRKRVKLEDFKEIKGTKLKRIFVKDGTHAVQLNQVQRWLGIASWVE